MIILADISALESVINLTNNYKMSDQNITISTYCAFEGFNVNDCFVLEKLYVNKGEKTYSEWRDIVQYQVVLPPAKQFTQNLNDEAVVDEKQMRIKKLEAELSKTNISNKRRTELQTELDVLKNSIAE